MERLHHLHYMTHVALLNTAHERQKLGQASNI